MRNVRSRIDYGFIIIPVVVTSNDPSADGQSTSSSSAS